MTSGGLGTTGYGLPAAIGVQIAHPEALVVDIAGEASILMNIQEMSTAAQYRLPVKIFILNNQWCGSGRSCCMAAVTLRATPQPCRTLQAGRGFWRGGSAGRAPG